MKRTVSNKEIREYLESEDYRDLSKSVRREYSYLHHNDVESELNDAIFHAFQEYDAAKGVPFNAYVRMRVNWSFKEFLSQNHTIPVSKETWQTGRRIMETYEANPYYTSKDVADKLGISLRTVLDHSVRPDAVSINQRVPGTDDLYLEDCIPASEEKHMDYDFKEAMNSCLSERERDVILSAFGFNGEEESLNSIGSRYGISHTAIGKIRDNALLKLGAYIGKEKLASLRSML